MEEIFYYESKIGLIKGKIKNDKLIYLKFVTEIEDAEYQETDLIKQIKKELEDYFLGSKKVFEFPIELYGTDFQKKVWNALLTIPYGETRTYKDIANIIGNAKACRAVGMANNKNPIPIIIPCHRVIGMNNKLVGYYYGIEMKKYLLELEKNNK